MEKTIGGVRVAYGAQGAGTPVFLLHGWGASGALFGQTSTRIAQKYRAVAPDFPGFGDSPEPPGAWDVAAYAALTRDFIAEVLAETGDTACILLGHSFGARVIIKLMGQSDLPFSVEKIILTGAAGVRPPLSRKTSGRTKIYKLGKKVVSAAPVAKLFPSALEALQQHFGSADYAAASPLMRQVLVKTVNEDLTDLLPRVTPPTLLLWGADDTVTPLTDGQTMERLMPDAGLAVLPGAGHFAFIDQAGAFNRVVASFLGID
ncbi:MAG: alpha/beta hydrolase [Oscillospiraceae bacterium]|nr:alpha/beta hydrolase [Oscillospiraceae bacterium]